MHWVCESRRDNQSITGYLITSTLHAFSGTASIIMRPALAILALVSLTRALPVDQGGKPLIYVHEFSFQISIQIPMMTPKCSVDPLILEPEITILTTASFSPGFEFSWSRCPQDPDKMKTMMTTLRQNSGARQLTVFSPFFNHFLVWGR